MTNRILAATVILGALVASGCGDDGDSDGDIAAFCDAADRIEESDPFFFVDDRDGYEKAIDEMEAAMDDARSNAPTEISDEVQQAAQDMHSVIAALRGIDDPSDEAEVDAALSALDDTAAAVVTGGSDIDAYLATNCDNRSGGDSE
ncbi:MAG: hypothetical protein QNM02_12620 [Acidimicrobiia bacterium]|nr:hypothetical protein [Acidimicrobiia bacterium]